MGHKATARPSSIIAGARLQTRSYRSARRSEMEKAARRSEMAARKNRIEQGAYRIEQTADKIELAERPVIYSTL